MGRAQLVDALSTNRTGAALRGGRARVSARSSPRGGRRGREPWAGVCGLGWPSDGCKRGMNSFCQPSAGCCEPPSLGARVCLPKPRALVPAVGTGTPGPLPHCAKGQGWGTGTGRPGRLASSPGTDREAGHLLRAPLHRQRGKGSRWPSGPTDWAAAMIPEDLRKQDGKH